MAGEVVALEEVAEAAAVGDPRKFSSVEVGAELFDGPDACCCFADVAVVAAFPLGAFAGDEGDGVEAEFFAGDQHVERAWSPRFFLLLGVWASSLSAAWRRTAPMPADDQSVLR